MALNFLRWTASAAKAVGGGCRHATRAGVALGAVAALAVFVLLVLLRKPLADWFWDEPRIEQLLAEGDGALAAGRLSAADGSGARER